MFEKKLLVDEKNQAKNTKKMLRLSRVLRQQQQQQQQVVASATSRMEILKKIDRDSQRHVYFPKHPIKLHVPSVLNATKQVSFYIPLEMTKPELREYLEKIYNVSGIKHITTTITAGRQKRDKRTGRWLKKTSDEKKATVTLSEAVQLDFGEEVKNEIIRFYDQRQNKQIMEDRQRKAAEMADAKMKEDEAKKLAEQAEKKE